MTRAPLRVGARFERRVRLDEDSISAFASASGDANPVHHDAEFARGTRFGGIIASGPQLGALMMGLSATAISAHSPMLGLDFRFRFRRAVPADTPLDLWWQVVAARDSERLGGRVLLLAGKATTSEGVDAVRGAGKVLLVERL